MVAASEDLQSRPDLDECRLWGIATEAGGRIRRKSQESGHKKVVLSVARHNRKLLQGQLEDWPSLLG